jgi:hypothetical protein
MLRSLKFPFVYHFANSMLHMEMTMRGNVEDYRNSNCDFPDSQYFPVQDQATPPYLYVPYPAVIYAPTFMPYVPYPYQNVAPICYAVQMNPSHNVVGQDQGNSARSLGQSEQSFIQTSPVYLKEDISASPNQSEHFQESENVDKEDLDDQDLSSGSLKCEVCCKSFMHKKHLRRHMIIHSNLREYVCQDCGKSFRRKDNLQSHRRLHTGEMPYECSICSKRFRHQSGLANHAKSCK